MILRMKAEQFTGDPPYSILPNSSPSGHEKPSPIVQGSGRQVTGTAWFSLPVTLHIRSRRIGRPSREGSGRSAGANARQPHRTPWASSEPVGVRPGSAGAPGSRTPDGRLSIGQATTLRDGLPPRQREPRRGLLL